MSEKRITWKDKDSVTSQREAIEALGDFISSSRGIYLLKSPPTNIGGDREKILQLKAFAEKWEIPFSISLLRNTVSLMDAKRWHGEHLVPAPKREDFKSNGEYWIAYTAWREEHTNNHHWVSSTEQYGC